MASRLGRDSIYAEEKGSISTTCCRYFHHKTKTENIYGKTQIETGNKISKFVRDLNFYGRLD